MQTASIKRGDPEKIYGIFRNLHSATLVNGDCAELLVSSDTPPTGYTFIPGVDVKQSGTTLVAEAVGIVEAGTTGILQGQFGRVQTYGFHASVKTVAAALAVGSVVSPDTAGNVIIANVGAASNISNSRIGVCIVLGAANRAGIFIQAMGR